MHPYSNGRHEHGQNFLTNTSVAHQVTDLVAGTSGPILEIGPGQGALTVPLQKLGRPITAVEVHPGMAEKLTARCGGNTRVITADFLRYRMPQQPCVVVGNLPFHLTTAILRKLLHSTHWTDAVLITQWEVARRRAGVGGSTMMTSQWSPFYLFELVERIAASSYTPRPSVDGGMITIRRREAPLILWEQRKRYAGFVHRVYTGPGRGISQILARTTRASRKQVNSWLGQLGIAQQSLPKDLSAEQWVGLYQRHTGGGTSHQLGKLERAGPLKSRARRRR